MSVTMFVISVYLLLFALIAILAEFGIGNYRITFYSLNFTWGRAFAYISIACLLITSGAIDENNYLWLSMIDVFFGIYLIVIALVFLLFHGLWRKDEKEFVNAKIVKWDNDRKKKEEERIAAVMRESISTGKARD